MTELNSPSDGDNGKHLWSSLLSEVQTNSALKLPSRRAILILGDSETGKTTLIARLQGTEDPKKSSGLEYHFLDVKDEERDDQTRLSVWILDGDPYHSNLLRYSINESNINDCLVMLVVSMSDPWHIMEQLKQWVQVIETHVERLKISDEDRHELQQSLVRHFQDYVEPDGLHSPSAPGMIVGPHGRRHTNPLHPPPQAETTAQGDKIVLPLTENALTKNIGVPLIVVVTKTDSISMLEKDEDFHEEHFDFIQYHIRRFCLQYGAALVYTSVKDDKNCDLLNRYLQHRIYGFPFHQTAYVVEKDSIFVPTGWDNEKKISILQESMSTEMKSADSYEDIMSKSPQPRKFVQREPEVVAEDEQAFLTRISGIASGGLAGPGTPGEGGSPRAARQESPIRTSTPRSSTAGGLRPKPGVTSGGPQNDGVLANFFNSLLNKKTGMPPASSVPVNNTSSNSNPNTSSTNGSTEKVSGTPTKEGAESDTSILSATDKEETSAA